MKFLRFGPIGEEKPGIIDQDGVMRDLSAHVDDIAGANLSEDSLSALGQIDPTTLPKVPENSRIGACVGDIGKVICIGLNYSDHAAESGMAVPPEPVIFFKATSAVCGPYDNIEIPRGSNETDWEVELAVIIGKHTKYVDEADAMDHVAGYAIMNDVSEREFQQRRSGQWVKGKSCDTFGPLGPWLVTKDEIADPQNLGMRLSVNGHQYQNGSTATMVYKVPFLISYLSQFMSLQPGDVISTGTPPGVGMGQDPKVYLKPGDVVELSIDGLGDQRQNVEAG
ncbi:fumarylacetoacetate hydrolase family protein [Yoonia sp. BS5-3]|uniref:Fumarylacetoacetate hydrolase family protein n=1 Tax=Yoonia phaeophyticola TaxID=3137369 RepID=A0ABZ2V5S6_9RHOB